jgi:hypothetical protein
LKDTDVSVLGELRETRFKKPGETAEAKQEAVGTSRENDGMNASLLREVKISG